MDIAFVLFFIFYFLNSKLDPSIIKILQNSRMCIFKWIFYKKNILLQYFLYFFDTKVKFHNRIFSSLNWVKMQCKPLFPSFLCIFRHHCPSFFFLLFYFIIVNIFLSYFFFFFMKDEIKKILLCWKLGEWVMYVYVDVEKMQYFIL